MSDLPGYARAQRECENQLPPEDGPSECPECSGRGVYLDEDGESCKTCCGSGFVDANGDAFDPDKAENDACDYADMKRDEMLTREPETNQGDYE